jgi:hypothetical protein
MNANLHVEPLPDDDVLFGAVQVAEADLLAQRNPAALSDRQLSMIACYNPAAAQVYAQKRFEARATTAASTAAPSRPVAPPDVAPFAKRARFTKADDFKTEEGWARWYEKNRASALPVWMFKELVDCFNQTFNAQQEKHSDLEDRVRRLESLAVLADSHIKNLESGATTRGAQWGGEFESGHTYRAGEFVGYKKSVWVALKDCATAPGAHLGDWDLVIAGSAKP